VEEASSNQGRLGAALALAAPHLVEEALFNPNQDTAAPAWWVLAWLELVSVGLQVLVLEVSPAPLDPETPEVLLAPLAQGTLEV